MGAVSRAQPHAPQIGGRSYECTVVERVLDEARAGRSAALVVRGEAGVGKTHLLGFLAGQATEFRHAQIAGVESETELAYAGLHQLCASVLDQLGALPKPQADAVSIAFGMTSGDAPDPFLVALANLGLVTASSRDRPLLCIIDDAQWLDEGSVRALGFIARRLPAERVAMVFAVRDPCDPDHWAGLPELRLRGLGSTDARALFDSALPGPIDPGVRERIITEAQGNPLALLELARRSGAADLAGGFVVPEADPGYDHLARCVMRRLQDLPPETRRLVVLAAADPVGEPSVMWRGADELGIPRHAADPATDVGLIELGAKVRFGHPMARSAAYWSAPLHERQAAHDALARVTDSELDSDRRAWHQAQATIEPAEGIALELERSATRAQRRGGLAATAAFLERAAALTPERAARARRVLAAAGAKREVGALDAASRLLSAVEPDVDDDLSRARLDALRGLIACDQLRGRAASSLLASTARRLHRLDPGLAREAHLEALEAAMRVGDRDGPGGVAEVARAALTAPPPASEGDIGDVLLDALARLLVDGHRAAAAALREVMTRALDAEDSSEDPAGWLRLPLAGSVVTVSQELWDCAAWHALSERHVQFSQQTGALVRLRFALNMQAWSHVHRGELEPAALLLTEDRAITSVTGEPPRAYADLLLGAFRGNDAQTAQLIDATSREARTGGLERVAAFAAYASAVLNNAHGRHAAARDAVRQTFTGEHAGYGPFIVPELAEAAARTHDAALLRSCLQWIRDRTAVTATDWSLGIEERIRALSIDGPDADDHYRRSIKHLGLTPIRTELGRTLLLHGEWLRRQQRRAEAREQLTSAHDMFDAMGLVAFAERARRELAATGASVHRRAAEARDELTPQEHQIAQLARDGLSNPEIGAQLFLSARTVEWHLRKVFRKLGISSRRALAGALPADP